MLSELASGVCGDLLSSRTDSGRNTGQALESYELQPASASTLQGPHAALILTDRRLLGILGISQ